MQDEYIKSLLDKYKAGTISEAEKAVLDQWYLHVAADSSNELSEAERLQTFDTVLAHLEELSAPRVKRLWPRIAAAASILVVLGAGAYLALKPKAAEQQRVAVLKNDAAPGHNQATLTLANGQRIVLTKGLKGQLATQSGTVISAGQESIAYDSKNSGSVNYNTLSTARGEQSPYPLTLADGTRVWLNAESSITFPTAFNGKERIVKLTGEAYFEVKHNAAQPFKVQTEKQTIEDIGTTFDVNAYSDEPQARTALIEGAVKVNQFTLKPGQAATTSNDQTQVGTADLETAIAWKNNTFRFDNEKLGAIMRQVTRWYDLEVTYENESLKDKNFGAVTTRFANASQLLHKLELIGVASFRIEGKKIIVTNYHH